MTAAFSAAHRFQSTLPQGSDPIATFKRFYDPVFQSTLPQGSDYIPQPFSQSFQNFNPRSRKGATVIFRLCIPSIHISIHAPARERPAAVPGLGNPGDFNPRSRKGATNAMQSLKRDYSDFNPRSRKGATIRYGLQLVMCKISIHAPARERRQPAVLQHVPHGFQSTLPQGSDTGFLRMGSIFP